MSKENAIVFCEGAFNTTNGKTAHGLVRFTERFNIVSVVDSVYRGNDSGMVLDGRPNGIPVFGSVEEAIDYASLKKIPLKFLIIGLAPDGGRLPEEARQGLITALKNKLSLVSGLHDFLSDDPEFKNLAIEHGTAIKDIRKPPSRDELHFFSGKIEKVDCLKLAILGTDSALGKRTTAWILVHGLRKAGWKTELVGTGQTAWLQGAKYSIIFDTLVNDFVSGEIEHAVYSAWEHEKPEVIVIEGQGSLLNPAYPGGFEILAAGRPDYIILQHAPRRLEYDGFPGYIIHPLEKQIQALEIVSGKKVIAITINHENMKPEEIQPECARITRETGLPAFDVLAFGAEELVKVVEPYIKK